MLIAPGILIKKYNIIPKGLIHVGAHQAEEAALYEACGFNPVVWVEGNEQLIPFISEKLKSFKNQKVFHALIDVEEKEKDFYITNDPQSSSLYDLKEHKKQYPSIQIEKKISATTTRLDSFFKLNNIDLTQVDFINLDIQGNELNALKSLGDKIKHVRYIYTEVQIAELYKGSAKLHDLDVFLFTNGFKRAELNLQYQSWGDAFYIRDDDSESGKKLALLQSRLLVASWPVMKIYYTFIKQSAYYFSKLTGRKK